MIALSCTVYDIFASHKNCQNCDLESEGQGQEVEKRDLRHSTRNARIHVSDFVFKMLAIWQHTFTHKGHTRTYTHTQRGMGDDYRQNLQSKFA